jgi:hypothetical protein
LLGELEIGTLEICALELHGGEEFGEGGEIDPGERDIGIAAFLAAAGLHGGTALNLTVGGVDVDAFCDAIDDFVVAEITALCLLAGVEAFVIQFEHGIHDFLGFVVAGFLAVPAGLCGMDADEAGIERPQRRDKRHEDVIEPGVAEEFFEVVDIVYHSVYLIAILATDYTDYTEN